MSPATEVRRIQKLRISVVDGPGDPAQQRQATMGQDDIRIGSDASSDFVVHDRLVSREHLSIKAGEGGWVLTDRGSTNGTHIGDLRIERAVTSAATLVRLGKTVLKLEPLSEHVEQEISRQTRFGRMLGVSPSMREMFAVLEKVAQSELTVLIEGETGTGKELAAEGLHEASERPGPFVTLNCGAIPRELIESEIVGHVEGAFTGAVRSRPGAFVAANGGTVFLDEVGELPLDMQAKLLRVLERREVKAVGADRSSKVDVRVVAATNRNLVQEVEAGKFRQDLYYRLAVVVVRIPPLRNRLEDLLLLTQHIQDELNRRRVALGREPSPPLDETALAMLRRYDFPGNVRELRNIVERWAILGATAAPGDPAVRSGTTASGEPDELNTAVEPGLLDLPYHEAKEEWIARFERAYVSAALERTEGNVSHAARDCRVDRRHFQRLMVRYQIRSKGR